MFLDGKQYPIPASEVKVGDELKHLGSTMKMMKLKVTKIDYVHRRGFFSPITEDGTLVVDGIVASSFSVHPEKSDLASFDKMGLFHWHSLSQVTVSPCTLHL